MGQGQAVGGACGVVGQVDATFLAIEQGRRNREVALGGELVGDALDVSRHAEDLLDHDDTAARKAVRPGQVGGERVAVGRSQLQVAHGAFRASWGRFFA